MNQKSISSCFHVPEKILPQHQSLDAAYYHWIHIRTGPKKLNKLGFIFHSKEHQDNLEWLTSDVSWSVTMTLIWITLGSRGMNLAGAKSDLFITACLMEMISNLHCGMLPRNWTCCTQVSNFILNKWAFTSPDLMWLMKNIKSCLIWFMYWLVNSICLFSCASWLCIRHAGDYPHTKCNINRFMNVVLTAFPLARQTVTITNNFPELSRLGYIFVH